MISTNKSSSGKSNKKAGGGKGRKYTKSTSSENQDDPKRDNDCSEGKYAVFKGATIECFAEQHMNIDDMKLVPEFYSRLADDATYKLYELIYNVKTLAHPTGGLVTTDIVNEALKIADVPPILGAPKPIYEELNYEKDTDKHFFIEDSVIDILEDIQCDILTKHIGPLGMKVGYFLTQKDTALVQTFYTKVCRAILSGSNKIKECLQILRTVEQFEPILPNLLALCALALKNYAQSMINYRDNCEDIVEETKIMYERVLLILMALSKNYSIRSATVYNELYNIVQQLIQILFIYANVNNISQDNNAIGEMKDSIKIKVEDDRKIYTNDETDISIIDDNNSSYIMNVNDIMEYKNLFDYDQEITLSKPIKKIECTVEDIEKICNVLVAIGENWMCIRGKIIELLLPNLAFDENDSQSMQFMNILAVATAKLLYNFDNATYYELDYWMYEVYGESIILRRPINVVSPLDLQI